MKRALLLTILSGLFAGLLINSCNDKLSLVGTTIQPPEDLITVYTDTFHMKASTVRLDSIYAKTSECLLGEMYDPVYGIIKADIICQFYCEENFQFSSVPNNNKIDSIELVINYRINSSTGGLVAYGDTLTPMQVSVFPINKPLKRNFYSNDDPEQYCDMENPMGSAAYTLYDLSTPDSIRYDSYYPYTPSIRVKLPTELGQKIYDETRNNPSTFKDQNSFNQFFPGVYITNTYGSGSLLLTSGENIAIGIYYSILKEVGEDDDPADTLETKMQWFVVSKEVIQINRFKNSNIDQLLVENPAYTYVKSPAGVCTQLVIPTTEITKKVDIKDRFINGFTLQLKYLPAEEWAYAYSPPEYLLLLPEDSVTSFFEKSSVEDDKVSYISYMPYDSYSSYKSKYETSYGYSPYNRTYSFGNISGLLKAHIENSPDKDLSLLAIPVYRKVYTSDNSTYYTTGISHSFNLTGVKIRTEEEFMKIIVLSSKYESR